MGAIIYKPNTQLIMSIKSFLSTALLLLATLQINAERFVILSDLHVVPGNANEIKLQEAIEEINSGQGELVIVSGDLTNEGSDEQLTNVKKLLDKINKPFFVIPGNHENNWSQSACKTFVDLWGNDRFVTETDSLVIVGINCGPYMKMGDGHIKQEDLFWLDNTLSNHVNAGKKVLSICHYPLMPDLDNYADYIKILEKYPVVSHICGHYHTFRHYKGGDIDGLICRALDMNNGNYGYSILDIENDSVKLYDKQLGIEPILKFSFPINHDIKPFNVVDTLQNELPDNFKIELVYRDSASIFTRVGVDNENIYVGNSLGYVKAVDKLTNKVKWQYHTDASLFSRPAVSSDVVIVPTADKRLLWFEKKSGKLLFQYEAAGPYVADGIVIGNTLYQGGYKTFQAWDVPSMKLIWSNDSISNYCQASPTMKNNLIAFGAWDTYLRLLDANTGNLNWKWNNGKNANMLGPGNCVPVMTNDKVIIVAPDRYMTALDISTGKQLWRNNDFKYRESLGVSEDGKTVYAKTMDGEIVAVSAESDDFSLLWKVDTGLGYEHAPCIVLEKDGIIYVGSRRGIMVAIDAQTHNVLFSYRLGNSEFNGWEVDCNGNVYTSLIEGSVWRITVEK